MDSLTVQGSTHGLVHQLPGTGHFPSGNVSFSQALSCSIDPLQLQFIPLQRSLDSVCILCPKLRGIIERQEGQEYQATLKDLEAIEKAPIWPTDLLRYDSYGVCRTFVTAAGLASP